MSENVYCSRCGFANSATDPACRQCGQPAQTSRMAFTEAPTKPAAWQQSPQYPQPPATPYEMPGAPPPMPYATGYPPPVDSPYASLPAYGLPQPLAGYSPQIPVWNNGHQLVCTKTVNLPHFCVKCNAPGQSRYTKKLLWNPPWVVLMILINLIVYVVVAMVTRKTMVVEFSLCERHANLRRNILITGWASLALSPVMWFAAAQLSSMELFWVGTFLFLSALGLYIGQRFTMPYPAKIDDRFGWLKGVCDEFRSRFPYYP